jgi:hypothetical protein
MVIALNAGSVDPLRRKFGRKPTQIKSRLRNKDTEGLTQRSLGLKITSKEI